MKPEPRTHKQNLIDTDRAVAQLRARELGHVDLLHTHPKWQLARLIETYAYVTGEVNRAKAWHDECARNSAAGRGLADAAHDLALAIVVAQDAHDRLVDELTR